MDLRANTAVDVLIGPFVDVTDGATAEEGESPTVLLSKNGQALAAKNDATGPVHDDAGYYNCELDATDMNTEGNLVLVVEATAAALPVRHEYNVLAEAAWDSMYSAKDDGFMDVNLKTIGRADTQETEADNLESACSNYSVTRGLTGTALPAAAADDAGGVPISDAGGLDLDTKLANTNEVTAARMGALTDWLNGERLDLILDAILVDTGTTLPAEHAALPTAAENRTEMDSNSTQLAAVIVDTEDIQSRLPAALAGGKMDSDATSISGDSTAADRLEAMMDGVIVAQVNDAGATTTAFAADGFTEATDDHFNGRLITFISGDLSGQQTDITNYDAAGGAQGNQEFTVTALTEAPGNNDYFVIH